MALPLTIDLSGTQCVCVGGGAVAARRVPALLDAGAHVRIIAPEVDAALLQCIQTRDCSHAARRYEPGDCADAFLVLAATGVPAVDRAVAHEVRSRGGLVCVASEPELGNCCFMATIRRGSLVVALQTGGAAPAVTARLRVNLERYLPEDIGEILDSLAVLRRALRRSVPDPAERARRWQRVVQAGVLDEALRGGGIAAVAEVERLLHLDE